MSARLIVAPGEVLTLTLSNPGRANSVTPAVVTDLARALRDAEGDASVKAVVLTGEARHFCAGADIGDMQRIFAEKGMDAAVDYMIEVWMPSVQRAAIAIRHCSKPTVAAINGAATAGGLDFALACDYAVAVPQAKVGQSYVNLGLVPVASGVHHLLSRLPRGVARRMLLGGKTSTAEDVYRWGLFDQLCAPEDLISTATAVAVEMSSAPAATRLAYARLLALDEDGFDRHLAHALRANTLLLQDPEVRASFAAVLAGEHGGSPASSSGGDRR